MSIWISMTLRTLAGHNVAHLLEDVDTHVDTQEISISTDANGTEDTADAQRGWSRAASRAVVVQSTVSVVTLVKHFVPLPMISVNRVFFLTVQKNKTGYYCKIRGYIFEPCVLHSNLKSKGLCAVVCISVARMFLVVQGFNSRRERTRESD